MELLVVVQVIQNFNTHSEEIWLKILDNLEFWKLKSEHQNPLVIVCELYVNKNKINKT